MYKNDPMFRELFKAFEPLRRRLSRRALRKQARELTKAFNASDLSPEVIVSMAFGITDLDWLGASDASHALEELGVNTNVRSLYRIRKKLQKAGTGIAKICLGRDGKWAAHREQIACPAAILLITLSGPKRLFQVHPLSQKPLKP